MKHHKTWAIINIYNIQFLCLSATRMQSVTEDPLLPRFTLRICYTPEYPILDKVFDSKLLIIRKYYPINHCHWYLKILHVSSAEPWNPWQPTSFLRGFKDFNVIYALSSYADPERVINKKLGICQDEQKRLNIHTTYGI